MRVSVGTAKGTRSQQEDRYLVLPTKAGLYLGVFDGHGGDECAAYCADVLPSILAHNPDTNPGLAAALAELDEETNTMDSGSTASIVFIPDGTREIRVAVIGDSPVIAKLNDGSIWVSPEHNVRSNRKEAEEAKKRGGIISGGYLYSSYSGNGLQMSRALGDYSLDKVLSRVPEMFSHTLSEDGFVMLATDGAIDPAHIGGQYGSAPVSPISDIVHLIEKGADAGRLVKNALDIPTRDNVTVILAQV